MTNLLFSKYSWHSVRNDWEQELANEINSYDSNRLLNTSEEDLCDYFKQKYKLEVPVLDREGIVVDQNESKIDVSRRPEYMSFNGGQRLVPGVTVAVTVPFVGEKNAFDIQPTTFNYNPPRASIFENHLILSFSRITPNVENLRKDIDMELHSIDTYLSTLRKDAANFNKSIHQDAGKHIQNRRKKLLQNQNLVASLGFKIKEREDNKKTFAKPLIRKRISPRPPAASTAPYKAEPVLSESDYDKILDTLDSMTDVMERSPSAFKDMNEEALRTLFLVPLNSHFEGGTSGETFNHKGKTDILVRVEDRNVFIGECKFWGGPKKMLSTIDQILSYSSWRDTKVAILVFNKNKDFSKVLQAIRASVPSHPNFKRIDSVRSESSFRYVFSHLNDINREIIITVLAYEVPA